MLADRLINYAFFLSHTIHLTFWKRSSLVNNHFSSQEKMPEYKKTTNYNKKLHGRAKRGKAFKILLWIWQEIEAKINHMAERSESELWNFCSEFDGRLKQK